MVINVFSPAIENVNRINQNISIKRELKEFFKYEVYGTFNYPGYNQNISIKRELKAARSLVG